MIVEVEVSIRGSKAAVWGALTDIERADTIVRGIDKIEIVERPASGLVGLRWRETRMLFGEPTTVEKSITEASDHEFVTRAEHGGFVFLTSHRIAESDGAVTVIGTHETKPQGLVASLKALPMFLFKGAIKKAILADLNDIKSAVERG